MAVRSSAAQGLRVVIASTIVVGALGYAIQLSAPLLLQDGGRFVAFSVVWSTTFLGVSALTGIQQEMARATHPSLTPASGSVLRPFLLAWIPVVVVISVSLAVVVGATVIRGETFTIGWTLVLGLVGYVFTAALTGIFYGLNRWEGVAFIVVGDAVVRAVLVLTGLSLRVPTVVLALCIAVPFGLVAGITWIAFRRRLAHTYSFDVGLGELLRHSGHTVLAAAGSGVLIAGLPMLIGVTSTHDDVLQTGSTILGITITRAPIVIPVIALQSFLITTVLRGGRPPAMLRRLSLVAAGAAVLLTAGGYLAGPWLVDLVSGGRFELDGIACAIIVLSAVLVAVLAVGSAALIAARRHAWNTASWLTAAAATVLLLVLPLGAVRVEAALLLPPLVGLGVQAVAAVRGRGGQPVIPARGDEV